MRIAVLILMAAAQPPPDTQLGMSLAARGEYEAAAAPLAKGCAQDPQSEDACYFHARNLFALGRYEEAVPAFQQALKAASPKTAWRVHRAMAMNYQALQHSADAERHYLEAIRLNQDAGVRVDYGAFLFREGRTPEALKLLEPAAKAGASARAHGEFGRALLQSGREAEAAAQLEKAVSMAPKEWTYRLLLGKAYVRLGRTADGERELQIARQGLDGSSTSK